jgi:hypothetical protein
MEINKAAKYALLGRYCRNCSHVYRLVPLKNGKTIRQDKTHWVSFDKIKDDELYCALNSDMLSPPGRAPRRTARMHKQQITPEQMLPKRIPPENICRFWDGAE